MEIDPSGELLIATGQDEFDIFVWNIQTTKLLDVLKSHSSTISCLKFSPTKPIFVSGSWDKTGKYLMIKISKSLGSFFK
jgi:periodic tryptophan protein 2